MADILIASDLSEANQMYFKLMGMWPLLSCKNFNIHCEFYEQMAISTKEYIQFDRDFIQKAIDRGLDKLNVVFNENLPDQDDPVLLKMRELARQSLLKVADFQASK